MVQELRNVSGVCCGDLCAEPRACGGEFLFEKAGMSKWKLSDQKKTAMYDFEVIWLIKRRLLEVRQLKVGSFVRFAICNGQKAKYW